MPNNDPSEILEWSDENLTTVVADLYREAETDEALHARLLANPLEVLNERIKVPESHAGGIFARERDKDALIMWVPAHGVKPPALPEGTSVEGNKPNFEILCTVFPPW